MFPGTSGTFNATLLEANYNTMISYATFENPSYFFLWYLSGSVTGGGTIGTIDTINNNYNYVDPSGTLTGIFGNTGFRESGSGSTVFTQTGNVDLRNGNSVP